jgi:geranylgeranyl pyrophosphate synthase
MVTPIDTPPHLFGPAAPLGHAQALVDGGHVAPAGYQEIKARFGAEIERRIDVATRAEGVIGAMVGYHLATGGKRMRALLPVWVCENLGGDPEDALDLGVGLELVHNATLVHDDLQDGDEVRRGRPAVWARWGAAQAVNAGDALVFQGFRSIARAPSAPRLFGAISAALLRVVEGQAMELAFQGAPEAPRLEAWQRMARQKTGALLGACMRVGAVAAGAGEAIVESAASYGESAGILFQAQDDYLDLVGDKGRERHGRDLIEGKFSFPIVWALEHAPPETLAPIHTVLRLPREERTWSMADAAIDALHRCGALDATAIWLRSAAGQALAHVMTPLVPGWLHECLAPVAHALGRDAPARR